MKFSPSYFFLAFITFALPFAKAEGSTTRGRGSPSVQDKINGYGPLSCEVAQLNRVVSGLNRDNKSYLIQINKNSKIATDLREDLAQSRRDNKSYLVQINENSEISTALRADFKNANLEIGRLTSTLNQSHGKIERLSTQLASYASAEQVLAREIATLKSDLSENQSLRESRSALEERTESEKLLNIRMADLNKTLKKESEERALHQERLENDLQDLSLEISTLKAALLEKEEEALQQEKEIDRISEEKGVAEKALHETDELLKAAQQNQNLSAQALEEKEHDVQALEEQIAEMEKTEKELTRQLSEKREAFDESQGSKLELEEERDRLALGIERAREDLKLETTAKEELVSDLEEKNALVLEHQERFSVQEQELKEVTQTLKTETLRASLAEEEAERLQIALNEGKSHAQTLILKVEELERELSDTQNSERIAKEALKEYEAEIKDLKSAQLNLEAELSEDKRNLQTLEREKILLTRNIEKMSEKETEFGQAIVTLTLKLHKKEEEALIAQKQIEELTEENRQLKAAYDALEEKIEADKSAYQETLRNQELDFEEKFGAMHIRHKKVFDEQELDFEERFREQKRLFEEKLEELERSAGNNNPQEGDQVDFQSGASPNERTPLRHPPGIQHDPESQEDFNHESLWERWRGTAGTACYGLACVGVGALLVIVGYNVDGIKEGFEHLFNSSYISPPSNHTVNLDDGIFQ